MPKSKPTPVRFDDCEHEQVWGRIPLVDLTGKPGTRVDPVWCPDCQLYLVRALVGK